LPNPPPPSFHAFADPNRLRILLERDLEEKKQGLKIHRREKAFLWEDFQVLPLEFMLF
jgi:hypothetical protein